MKRLVLLTLVVASLAACQSAASPSPAPTAAPTEAATMAPTPEPTMAPTPEPTPMPTEAAMPAEDIVAVATGAGTFTTLLAAAQAAGIVADLQGAGPLTLFAPTDEAFAKIPKADLDALLADPAKLKAVLYYHVVSGAVKAADVAGLTEATTLAGGKIAISVADGVVRLNDAATVTATDIMASNGVIHVIDTVLLPPAE